jgi:type 1 fimbria pilin
MDVTINALVNELVSKDMFDVLCGTQPTKDFTITLKKCADVGETSQAKLAFTFRGAILTSENHSTDIGGNETVDLTYSIQIGGANDNSNGLFMSGSYESGSNPALNSAYPYGLTGLLQDFYGIGTARNY